MVLIASNKYYYNQFGNPPRHSVWTIYQVAFSIIFSGSLIFYFISLYSLSSLLSETNSPWLIYESIKALKTKTSIVFNFGFASNTILSWFLFLDS